MKLEKTLNDQMDLGLPDLGNKNIGYSIKFTFQVNNKLLFLI